MAEDSVLRITTSNPRVQRVCVRFVEALLLGQERAPLKKYARGYEEIPLLHLLLAIDGLVSANSDGTSEAKRALAEASALIDWMDEREYSLYTIVHLWAAKKPFKALDLLRRHLFRFPEDLLGIKLAERIYKQLGTPFFALEYEALIERLLFTHPESPHFRAIYADALNALGDYAGARKQALCAVEACAHPYAEMLLTAIARNTGALTTPSALAMLCIRGGSAQAWEGVAFSLLPVARGMHSPLITALGCYVCAQAGFKEEGERLQSKLIACTHQQTAEERLHWERCGECVMRGLMAFNREAYEEAAEHLHEALEQRQSIVGRETEVACLYYIYIRALTKAGHTVRAQQALGDFLAGRSALDYELEMLTM